MKDHICSLIRKEALKIQWWFPKSRLRGSLRKQGKESTYFINRKFWLFDLDRTKGRNFVCVTIVWIGIEHNHCRPVPGVKAIQTEFGFKWKE